MLICGKICFVMAKIKQRNWLLIITGCLLVGSILVVFLTTRQNLGLGVCYYEGIEYQQNEFVPNYEGRNDCYCSWTGQIVCEESSELVMSYEDFTSQNLLFTYAFRNFLEKEGPDSLRVSLSSVKQDESSLEVVLEREVLCSQDGEAPVQTALYKVEDESLVLTTVTNRDELLYDRVCLVANSFLLVDQGVEDLQLGEKEEFSLFYQDDVGRVFNLKNCFANSRLYSSGDVFKDSVRDLLCTCIGPDLECEEL